MPRRRFSTVPLLLAVLSLLGGCAADRVNPTFPVTREDARYALEQMAAEPNPPDRPILVVSGWGDWGGQARRTARELKNATGSDRVATVVFPLVFSMDACRDRVLEVMRERFPSDDPDQTMEVDIIGLSMGGLVARYAALPPGNGDPPRARLNIRRLFTISSPHLGAQSAGIPFWDPLMHDMKPGSPFIRELNDARSSDPYPIIPYVRLTDTIVGADNAAPPGQTPYWVSNGFLETAHDGALNDPRILADIARRIRGETPFTAPSPAPLPQ